MSDATPAGSEDSLPLVDLIACAICSVLLLVFAALASQGGLEGAPNGFAVLTFDWEFPAGTAAGLDAEAKLDSRALLLASDRTIRPGAGWFPGQTPRAGGSWSSPSETSPAVSLIAEFPAQMASGWQVRLFLRQPGRPVTCHLAWSFRGTALPTGVTASLVDQSTGGTPVPRSLKLTGTDAANVRVVVDVGAISLKSGTP